MNNEHKRVMPMRTGESLKSLPRKDHFDKPEIIDCALFWLAVSCVSVLCAWVISTVIAP